MPIQTLPAADLDLRRLLLDQYLEAGMAGDLAEWLRDLGQDPSGSVEERKQRIRSSTKYLSMPVPEFPRQTRYYLNPLSSDQLADICLALGLDDSGSKDARYRRVYREVGFREGWLARIDIGVAGTPTLESVAALLEWYPITRKRNYEKEYCEAVRDELVEAFGNESVYEQLPVQHGTTLRIDFHVGHPQGGGTGIEVKVPASNSEAQRALGQIDQYIQRYGRNLAVLLVPDFLSPATRTLFLDQLAAKGVQTIVKDFSAGR